MTKDLPYMILVTVFGFAIFVAGRMSAQPVMSQTPVLTAPQVMEVPSAPIIVIASTNAPPVEDREVIPAAPVSVTPKAGAAPKVVKTKPTYPKPDVIELEETPSSNTPGF